MSELTEDSVRADVRAWLEANWSPELGLVEWRNKLADSGWGVPTWPKEWYGRDLPQSSRRVPAAVPAPAIIAQPVVQPLPQPARTAASSPSKQPRP